jgi:hypothetical protein
MVHIQGSEYVRTITNMPFFNTTRNIDDIPNKQLHRSIPRNSFFWFVIVMIFCSVYFS